MSYSYSKTSTKVFDVYQVGLDMYTNNEKFRKIRSGAKYKCKSCHVCNHRFEDNEKISLLLMNKDGNKVACHDCAVKIMNELKEEK